MGCKIIFSPQAIADLEAAVRFIAGDNPGAAVCFGNALIDRTTLLENFPLLGAPYAKRPGMRKLVCRPYLIFYRYRERENCLDILRFWHSAQREPDLPTAD